jgi:hypothetical protein
VYKISEITLHQPTIQSLTGGRDSTRVATQQTQILREKGKEPCSLSGLCKEELRTLILNKFSLAEHELIIGIDANEDMNGTPSKSLRVIMADLGLFDALEYANPGLTRKITMLNCTSTIDFLFLTHGLKKILKQGGEMERNETSKADHPTLFLDLNGKGVIANDFTAI